MFRFRVCFVFGFFGFGCFYVLIMRLIRFFGADNGRKVARAGAQAPAPSPSPAPADGNGREGE